MRVSCGQSGPHIVILNMSLANARRVLPLFPSPRSMAFGSTLNEAGELIEIRDGELEARELCLFFTCV